MPFKPVLSVIIINFKTPDYTFECVQSIFDNVPAIGFEVIVVDNGSEDGSLEWIREAFPQVLCIQTGANLGFSKANNLGIHNARGEYVLLLNSDTKILDQSLDRLLEYLSSHPQAGVVGPRQVDGEGKLQLSWGSFPTLVSELFRKLIHYRLSINDLKVRDYLEEKYAGPTQVDWVSGSCLLARKKALLEAGFLDERFFMYFEDIDLCRRIQNAGWQIHYNSDWTILHYGGASAKKNILHVLVEYRKSQLYFTRKYYGWKGVTVLKMLLLCKSLIHFIRWGIVFARDKILTGDAERSFANLLLSKKTLELVLGP
jgi:GT2 family glycosyltransferase